MADFVILQGGVVAANGSIIVTSVDGSSGAPTVSINRSLALTLEELSNQGFQILFAEAAPQGIIYTLTRAAAANNPGDFFRENMGEAVTVETDAGTITGTVQFVGTDFVELLEPGGDVVLVPFASINASY